MIDRGERRGGYPVWGGRSPGAEILFVGRGPAAPRPEVLRAAAGRPLDLAWAEQRHGAEVLDARPGCAGQGDALVSRRAGLAVGVAVADCVPAVLVARGAVAAVHAGWRGIESGIVEAAVARIAAGEGEIEAWIGPAIGSCCYEVGHDVARRVAAAAGDEIVRPGTGERPHLDLQRAVKIQLHRAGVASVRRLDLCTRCHPERLCSYRREGRRAGRNYAFAWLR